MATAAPSPGTSVVLRELWRARWLILVTAALAGVGGFVVSGLQSTVYSAESRLVLAAGQDFDPLGRQSYADSSRFVANQVSVVSSQPVVDAALRTLDDGTTREGLLDSLEVSASADADVIAVRTSGPTPEVAAERADALVDGYRSYVRERVAERAAAAAAATTDPVVVDQITTHAAAYGDGLLVVDMADVPTRPSAPVPLRDAFVLAAVAALAAAGLALLRRPRLPTPTRSSQADGVPVLGAVSVSRPRGLRGDLPSPGDYALALVSLGYVADPAAGPVLVTGLTDRSGAAAVVHGLATAAAVQGQRVLVVDAEPESRQLVHRMGVEMPSRPLDDLARGADESQVLVRSLLLQGPGTDPAVDLAVLGTQHGVVLSDADAAQTALSKLQASYDLVLLHPGPVTGSPLALALLRQAGAVVAVQADKDGDQGLVELRQWLQLAGAPLAGVMSTRRNRGWIEGLALQR